MELVLSFSSPIKPIFGPSKQRFIETIDLEHYFVCTHVTEQPNPERITYAFHATKRNTAAFMATVCETTSHSMKADPNFLHTLNTVPSSETRFLFRDDCSKISQALTCFSNSTKSYTFSEIHKEKYAYLLSTTTSVTSWTVLSATVA